MAEHSQVVRCVDWGNDPEDIKAWLRDLAARGLPPLLGSDTPCRAGDIFQYPDGQRLQVVRTLTPKEFFSLTGKRPHKCWTWLIELGGD